MATATKKGTVKKSASAKGKTAKAPAKTASKKTAATEDGPSKRELQRERDNDLRAKVVDLREADTSWSEIAEALAITSGKAQFLMMQQQVEDTPKLKIRFKDDETLVAGIVAAREAEDAHSSWGWIAARTGISEGKVKALAEEAGLAVSGSNIAVARAETNGGGKKADTKTRKQATTTKTTTTKKGAVSAKTAAARKRAAKKAGKTADPS